MTLPSTVKVMHESGRLSVEGPKGTLMLQVPSPLTVTITKEALTVQRPNDERAVKALHGLTRALIANAVAGVTTGFQQELEVAGVGYRAQAQGKQLTLTVGLSHPVVMQIPEGVTVDTPKPTQILIKGSDKHLVGQFAANIRRIAPPEPYKGKGIRYAGEVIRRKAGKAATGTGAKAAA